MATHRSSDSEHNQAEGDTCVPYEPNVIQQMINLYRNDDATQPLGFWAGLPAGLLIGGLAGALGMLLLAPQSGRRTRVRLQRRCAEWCEQATGTMDGAMASARITAHHVTHEVSQKAEELTRSGWDPLASPPRR